MSTPYQQQLDRICTGTESLAKAKELLSLAQAKTVPGSGHSLGANVIALPAICAFLASEWLGNGDVPEKVAQQASCVNPKAFQTALNTTRSALADSLRKRSARSISYSSLARKYGLKSDAMYWIEEVDKELRKKDDDLKELEVSEESIIYCVFYWTCIALHIRTVKSNAIIQEYGVPLGEFQDLQALLDSACRDLQDSIDEQLSSNRSQRFVDASPSKASLSSPKKPATSASSSKVRTSPGDSPLKRKTSIATLPFVSPPKKPRTASPIKLNRIPVGSGMLTNNTAAGPSRTPSPVKLNRLPTAASLSVSKTIPITPTRPRAYGIARTNASPEKSAGTNLETEDREASPRKLINAPVEAVGAHMGRLALKDKTPSSSPRKSPHKARIIAEPSTPTPRRGRPPRRATHAATEQSSVNMDRPDEASSSSSSEEEEKPPCRHRVRPFSDRQFYLYRDPRVSREWDICEKNMKALVAIVGHPFDTKEQTVIT